MARGRTKGKYITDGHTGEPAGFTFQVPDNLYANADLGWTAAVSGETTHPKNFKPRHIEGIDVAGHRHSLVAPDPTADLWTGVVTTWTGIANDGTTYTATATGYVGEAYTV
jgi:hypothetical protein